MYGIDLGVTPPGTIRKMNQDKNCVFNANPMNELSHDYVYYDYDYDMFMLKIEPMYDYVWEQEQEH
jgi:hypothetical protein